MELLPWILFAIACGLAAVGWHKVYLVNGKKRWITARCSMLEAANESYCEIIKGAGRLRRELDQKLETANAELRELTAALSTRDKKMKALSLKHVKVCKDLTDARAKNRRKPKRNKHGQFARKP